MKGPTMKQKWIPLKKKMPYICEHLFGNRTAREINNELYAKHLTTSKNYSGRKCKGGLAIYLWTYNFLYLEYNVKRRNVSYTIIMSKSKDEIIKELLKKNKKLEKENKDLHDTIEITREILKKYKKEPTNKDVKDAIKSLGIKARIRNVLRYLGIARSSYYYKDKTKNINARYITIWHLMTLFFRLSKYFKRLGRGKLLPILNAACKLLKIKEISDYELKRTRELFNIKAELVFKRKRPNDPKKTDVKIPNLVGKNWHSDFPGKLLFTDVTYVYNGEEWLYVSLILDGYDFNPIGFAVSKNNDADLIIASLKSIKINIDGAILHSDHGAVYSSLVYNEFCKKHNIRISMGRVGKSLDNYPIEHFWCFLKMMSLWHIPEKKRTVPSIEKEIKDFTSWFIGFFRFGEGNKKQVNNLYNLLTEKCPTFFA